MTTHYVRYDEPNATTRLARAVCGRLINPHREHDSSPSCLRCQAWLTWYESLDFGQNDKPTVGDGR